MKGKKPIFSYKDTWDLTVVLNPIIAEGLIKFRDTLEHSEKNFIPCNLTPNAPKGWEGVHVYDEGDIDLKQEWLDTLDKMIYAFKNEEPEYEGDFIPMTLTPTDESLWEKYLEDMNRHSERVKEGLHLFAKHYHDLWW